HRVVDVGDRVGGHAEEQASRPAAGPGEPPDEPDEQQREAEAVAEPGTGPTPVELERLGGTVVPAADAEAVHPELGHEVGDLLAADDGQVADPPGPALRQAGLDGVCLELVGGAA